MITRQKTVQGVKALRGIATKEAEAKPDKALAEVLGVEEAVVTRIEAGTHTEGDLIEAAAGIVRLAAKIKPEDDKPEEQDVATKSFGAIFGDDGNFSDLDRDASGRRMHKELGSSPGDVRHRQREAVRDLLDDGDGRDASGRGRKLIS